MHCVKFVLLRLVLSGCWEFVMWFVCHLRASELSTFRKLRSLFFMISCAARVGATVEEIFLTILIDFNS